MSKLTDPRFADAYRRLNEVTMPVTVAFKLKKIAKKINEEQWHYEDMRKELLQKFGDKKEDGTLDSGEDGMVKMSGMNKGNFIKEHSELLNMEVEVGHIKIKELEGLDITPNDLLLLDGIIVD